MRILQMLPSNGKGSLLPGRICRVIGISLSKNCPPKCTPKRHNLCENEATMNFQVLFATRLRANGDCKVTETHQIATN